MSREFNGFAVVKIGSIVSRKSQHLRRKRDLEKSVFDLFRGKSWNELEYRWNRIGNQFSFNVFDRAP